MLQNIIILVIVAAAVFFIIKHFKKGGCNCCDTKDKKGCGCNKPKE
ncbi:MAG: hypothetical protein LBL00_02800 [Endomicrobium sp.]|jgi:large-conductance mechanosensitive channel|nr:hypothetical protein [Endomicrobium sp.]